MDNGRWHNVHRLSSIVYRPSSIVHRLSSIVYMGWAAFLLKALVCVIMLAVFERVRVSAEHRVRHPTFGDVAGSQEKRECITLRSKMSWQTRYSTPGATPRWRWRCGC